MGWLDRERTIAPPGFNRWLVPPAALAVHLCIGQAYATSVYKTALVKHFGASLTEIGVIFSIAIVMLGLSAAIMGTWVDKNGPRKAMFTSAAFWASGFLIGSLGIFSGQLWLVYLGYGVVGGIGLGIGYISPVSTLIKWFPDRPGLATGMAIMGFGGGALIASPVSTALLKMYDPNSGAKGWVASGESVGKLFLTLAVVYLAYMMFGAFTIKVPAEGWKPAGFDPAKVRAASLVTTENVSAKNAVKTRQFWLVWIALFCNVTAGIGILEQAAPMIQDFFRQPDGTSLASAAVAAGFVGLLSIGNMSGRFAWSATSDVTGRKRIYMVFLGVGARALHRAGAGWLNDHRPLRGPRVRDHLLLRRRIRDRPRLPARPLRHFPGRRHPRPSPDGLVRGRRRRAADRQRFPGRAGQTRRAQRRVLPARFADHGGAAGDRFRGEPAGHAGAGAIPRATSRPRPVRRTCLGGLK